MPRLDLHQDRVSPENVEIVARMVMRSRFVFPPRHDPSWDWDDVKNTIIVWLLRNHQGKTIHRAINTVQGHWRHQINNRRALDNTRRWLPGVQPKNTFGNPKIVDDRAWNPDPVGVLMQQEILCELQRKVHCLAPRVLRMRMSNLSCLEIAKRTSTTEYRVRKILDECRSYMESRSEGCG